MSNKEPKFDDPWFEGDINRAKVFFDRFILKDENLNPLELAPDAVFHRVATELASVEKDVMYWHNKFHDILYSKRGMMGGRCLAGCGTDNLVRYNCFGLPSPEDSREGIMKVAEILLKVESHGGGAGINVSTLRPKGTIAKGVRGESSGSVSWCNLYDAVNETIKQGGSRRGALMLNEVIHHPDIFEFIDVKKSHKSRLKNANLSVLVTDEFMDAVLKDQTFVLHFNNKSYEEVNARFILKCIQHAFWKIGDPGIIFIDRMNQLSNQSYLEDEYCRKIVTTNPCGEIPSTEWDICDLGSINLSQHVNENGEFQWELLTDTIQIMVRMLDNIHNTSPQLYSEFEYTAKTYRKIGLGTMGLADALIQMNIPYNSLDAIDFVNLLYERIAYEAYNTSATLAEEKGACLAYSDKLLGAPFLVKLSQSLRNKIKQFGLRNISLLTSAPTGTISQIVGCSAGIEPIFGWEIIRQDRVGERSEQSKWLKDYSPDDPWMVTAKDIKPKEHINMQAAIQKWIDQSVSKTINAPRDQEESEIGDLIMMANEKGLKGFTYYRAGSREDVISDISDEPILIIDDSESARKHITWGEYQKLKHKQDLRERSTWMNSITKKIKIRNDKYYITLSHDTNGLYEIFISSTNMAHIDWTTALSMLISAVMRRYGNDILWMTERLKKIASPAGGAWIKGKYVASIPAAIGIAIEEFLNMGIPTSEITDKNAFDYITTFKENDELKVEIKQVGSDKPLFSSFEQCPSCGNLTAIRGFGCLTCVACGARECG